MITSWGTLHKAVFSLAVKVRTHSSSTWIHLPLHLCHWWDLTWLFFSFLHSFVRIKILYFWWFVWCLLYISYLSMEITSFQEGEKFIEQLMISMGNSSDSKKKNYQNIKLFSPSLKQLNLDINSANKTGRGRRQNQNWWVSYKRLVQSQWLSVWFFDAWGPLCVPQWHR